jgi:hypothetical protein
MRSLVAGREVSDALAAQADILGLHSRTVKAQITGIVRPPSPDRQDIWNRRKLRDLLRESVRAPERMPRMRILFRFNRDRHATFVEQRQGAVVIVLDAENVHGAQRAIGRRAGISVRQKRLGGRRCRSSCAYTASSASSTPSNQGSASRRECRKWNQSGATDTPS